MEQFEIILQTIEKPVEYICCVEKDLWVKVITPFERGTYSYEHDPVLISAVVYPLDVDGNPDIENPEQYDFEIMDIETASQGKDWTMNLLYDAIDFYYEHRLCKEHHGIQHGPDFRLYPLGCE